MNTFARHFILCALPLFAALLTSTDASAQGAPGPYANPNSCPVGWIVKPVNGLYYCIDPATQPGYVPPPGSVTGMSLSQFVPNQTTPPKSVFASDAIIDITLTGQNKCDYKFVVRNSAAAIVYQVAEGYTSASGHKYLNLPLAANGYWTPGNYQLALESSTTNKCLQVPPPVAFRVFAAPITLDSNFVDIHSKDPNHFNAPFPAGAQMTYDMGIAAYFPGCLVDVSITGPETHFYPAVLLTFPLVKHDFSLNHAGTYTMTYATSAGATESQQCRGGPVSKSFQVYLDVSKIGAVLQPGIQVIKP